MRNLDDFGPCCESAAIATARTGSGTAVFQRESPTFATLKLTYTVQGMTARMPDGDLEQGVRALCEQEIAVMRGTLARLGEDLATQLSDEGKTAPRNAGWEDHDERDWSDRGTSFQVWGSRCTSLETMTTEEGVADAHLVAQAAHQTIEQREIRIRNLYAQILAHAQKERGHRR